MSSNRISRRAFTIFIAVCVMLMLAASAMALTSTGTISVGKPGWQRNDEKTSDAVATQLIGAVPYPTSQMKDSLERRNLRDRLLRFNKPNKVGYLYLMSFGKFVGYYAIKGKVTSSNSQMTTTAQTWDCGGMDGGCQVPSIGDDGSFGPNEGGDRGVFFFTTSGVMVETTLDWVYSDAPLQIDVPNLLARKK